MTITSYSLPLYSMGKPRHVDVSITCKCKAAGGNAAAAAEMRTLINFILSALSPASFCMRL